MGQIHVIFKLIDELSATYQECGLIPGQTLILEVRGEDGDWPRDNISPRSMEAKTSIPSLPPRTSVIIN